MQPSLITECKTVVLADGSEAIRMERIICSRADKKRMCPTAREYELKAASKRSETPRCPVMIMEPAIGWRKFYCTAEADVMTDLNHSKWLKGHHNAFALVRAFCQKLVSENLVSI